VSSDGIRCKPFGSIIIVFINKLRNQNVHDRHHKSLFYVSSHRSKLPVTQFVILFTV